MCRSRNLLPNKINFRKRIVKRNFNFRLNYTMVPVLLTRYFHPPLLRIIIVQITQITQLLIYCYNYRDISCTASGNYNRLDLLQFNYSLPTSRLNTDKKWIYKSKSQLVWMHIICESFLENLFTAIPNQHFVCH